MYQKVKLISKRNEVIRVVENDRAFILKTFKERKDFENECNVLSLLKKSKLNVPRIIKADNNVLWLEDLGDYTFLKWYEELEDKNSSDYEEIIIKLCNWLKNFYHALSDSNNNSYVLYDVNFRNFIIKNDEIFGIDFEQSQLGKIESDAGKIAAFALTYDPSMTEWKIKFHDRLLFLLSSILNIDINLIIKEEEKELQLLKERRKGRKT